MKEIEKQIDSKSKELQNKVKESADNVKKDNLNTVDSKHNELKNHF